MVSSRGRRAEETARRHEAIRELYRAGVPVAEIAARFGLSAGYVWQLGSGLRRNRVDPERDARVVEVYAAGHTVAETAGLTGVAKTQVGRIIQRAGVSRRRGPAPAEGPDEVDWRRVVEAYRSGVSLAELGRRWGCAQSTIRAGLIRAGVAIGKRRTGRRTGERHARVRQLAGQGRPVEEIAEATGYSIGYVRALTGGSGKDRDRFSERDRRVVEVYLAGRTIAETAAVTGVNRTQVWRIVQRAGVSRRRGPVPAGQR